MDEQGGSLKMNRFVYGLLVVLTTFLMGSSFAVGKMGLLYISPLLLVGIRFTLAGIVMAIIVCKKPLPKQLMNWFKIFCIGLFQTAGVMGCIFLSLRSITAGETSILTFSNPLIVVILSTILLRLNYEIHHWIGVLIGFSGVFITLGYHLEINEGMVLGLSAAFSWAIATILIKKWGSHYNIWVLTAYQMLFGGILLLIMSPMFETPKLVITPASLFIVIWLAIMASIIQFAIWFYLLSNGDPGKTSAFLFLAPFFGVLSGWVLLDEVVEWYVYIGGFLIFLGIFFVNWTFSSKK
jgi:drug/metabolite transporter (DMT)-like permease